MSAVFITAYSFVAAVIGAGFASGQEILCFFVAHGKWGIAGMFLSALIFGWFSYFIIEECRKRSISDYGELLNNSMGRIMKAFTVFVTLIFSMCAFAVMTACFGEVLYLIFDADKRVTRVLFAVVCTIIVCFGSDKALKLNGILGIITVVGIISAVLYILRYREHQVFSPQISAISSGAEYSGYNLIGAGVILAGMSKGIKSKTAAALTGIISAAALLVMMLLIYFLLSIYNGHINLSEIPMLTLAMRENKIITYFYCAMLVLAVITTAISSSISVTEIMSKKIDCRICAIITGVIGVTAGGAGFADMINTAYRICGYLGIIIIICLIINLKILKNVVNKSIIEN